MQLGAKILSTINGIESNGIKSKLTLDLFMDLFMRMERGKDERLAIVWSEVNEVGPKVVQPLRPIVHNVITSNPLNTAKPKSVWRPCQSRTLVNPAHSQCLKSGLATTVISHITTKPSNSGSKSQDVMVLSLVVSASSRANKPVSVETHPDGAHLAHSDSRYATITEPVLLSLVSPSISRHSKTG